MQTSPIYDIELVANFFFLAIVTFLVFVYAHKLKMFSQEIIKLREKSLQYELLFQATSEGVFRCNREGNILIINAAGALKLGFSEENELYKPEISIQSFIQDQRQRLTLFRLIHRQSSINKLVIPVIDINQNNLYLELSAHLREVQGETIYEGIFRDVTSRIQIERELDEYKTELENKVEERTLALSKSNQDLKAHRKLLQKLSRNQFNIQEEVKKRIAHELHDSAGQLLSALQINIARIVKYLKEHGTPELGDAISQSNEIADSLQTKIHDLSLDLRPIILDDFGLYSAVNWMLNRFKTRASVNIEFSFTPEYGRFDSELENIAFRLIQEIISNVEKHAKASIVQVDINIDEYLSVVVTDNGIGFNVQGILSPKDITSHMGVLGLREQVESMGGIFHLESVRGEGTVVHFRLKV